MKLLEISFIPHLAGPLLLSLSDLFSHFHYSLNAFDL